MHVVSYQHQHQHQYQYRVSIFESESESSMTMMSMKLQTSARERESRGVGREEAQARAQGGEATRCQTRAVVGRKRTDTCNADAITSACCGIACGIARTHAPASNCGIIPPCSFARFAATTPPSPEQPRRLGSAPSLISVEIMTADCPHAAAVANGVIPAYLVAERGGEGRKAEECEGMRRK